MNKTSFLQKSNSCFCSLQTTGAHSKLVVCGLTSSLPAITDTGDRGFLSVCGFDLGALTVIRNFSLDLI